MIRNAIFDWSGTLVDDLQAVLEATNFVFRQAGVSEITREQFREEFQLPFKGFYDRFVPHVPLDKLEVWFHGHFRQCQHTVTPLPHARPFLELCRRRSVRTFALTAVPAEHFGLQARVLGLGHFIDTAYTGVIDKTARIKELLDSHTLVPEETVFIGDMQHDIDTAHHGGVHSCAVLTGYNSRAQLLASRPKLIVEHLGELAERLERSAWDFPTASAGEHSR